MIYTSHYRKKDGAWQLIISFKDSDGSWKQKSKQGFETRSAAKQYEAQLIEDVIEGVLNEDDIPIEVFPCEATIERWRKWASQLIHDAEGQIRSAAYRILDLSEEFLGSTESLLERMKERITCGWLAVTLRLMINTGGSCLVSDSS